MKICIIGLGLLGGSFSLGLRQKSTGYSFIGVDSNPEHCRKAMSLGLADEILSFEEGIKQASLVVLATPVNTLLEQLPAVLDLISPDGAVIDFGSTKELICNKVSHHSKRDRFIAMHPIAGTEHSGPEAAFAGLLFGKHMIICEKEKSNHQALEMAESLLLKLTMQLSYMNPHEHDRHIAYVSHLSHISSFALGVTVLDKEKDEKSIFDMAGSGFSSTVRLAKSSPAMWAPIFTQNTKYISEALGCYIDKLKYFKEIIDAGDERASFQLMTHANEIRRILEGIDKT